MSVGKPNVKKKVDDTDIVEEENWELGAEPVDPDGRLFTPEEIMENLSILAPVSETVEQK